MPRRLSVPLLALLLAALVCPAAAAAGTGEGEAPDAMVVFYFTGISCTHCAQIDPVLFGEWRKAFPDLVIVEYEIQAHPENAYVQNVFADRYGTPRGSPLLIVSPYASFLGEAAILGDGYAALHTLYDAPELRSPSFTLAHIDMAALYGSPTVWRNDTVLARTETGGDGLLLRLLLAEPDTAAVISRAGCIPVPPAAVPIAGGTVPFDQAAGIGSWTVRWNGTPADCSGIVPSQPDPGLPSPLPAPEVVPLATIVTLAAVDAINPCALAVLVVILTAVVARYPDRPFAVLRVGMAFAAAVAVVYFIYGLLLVLGFSLLITAGPLRLVFPRLLGAAAVLLGAAYLAASRSPLPGNMLSMPKRFGGAVTAAAAGAMTVRGAAVAGAVVSFLLLPCTMGPYLIAGAYLAGQGAADVLIALAVYNVVFVLPMAVVILAVAGGMFRMAAVSRWRAVHAGMLRTAGGLLLIVLGIALLLGLV